MALPATISNVLFPGQVFSQNIGPHQDGNGNLYVVFRDSASNNVRMEKSADDGDTWAEVDASNAPTNTTLQALAAFQDGTIIHVAAQLTGSVEYNTFNTSDAASNPDTWQTTNQVVDSTATPDSAGSYSIGIALRSDGDIIICYNADDEGIKGTRYERFSYAIHEGVSWSADNAIDDGGALNFFGGGIVRGESDKMHFVYAENNAGTFRILHKSLTSGNTLSSAEAASDTDTLANNVGVRSPVYYDAAGVERITAIWYDTSRNVFTSEIDDDGVPAAEEGVEDAGTGDNTAAPPILTVGDADKIYAHWVDDTSNDLFHDANDNSGGWGTDVETLDAVNISAFDGNVFIRSGNTIFGYVYNDGGTIKYNEFTLETGGLTVGDTLNGTYNVADLVGDTLNGTYHVADLVGDTLNGTYHVAALIGDTLNGTYDVFLQVGDTLNGTYDVADLVGDTLNGTYDLDGVVGDTLNGTYNVADLVGDTLAGTYDVFLQAGDTLVGTYHVADLVGDTLNGTYHVAALAGDTLAGTYNVADLIGDTLAGTYNVALAVGDTVNGTYNVAALVGDTLAGTYNVAGLTGDTLAGTYNVAALIGDTLNGTYDVAAESGAGTVGDTLNGTYNVAVLVGDTLNGTYDVYIAVANPHRTVNVSNEDRTMNVPARSRTLVITKE